MNSTKLPLGAIAAGHPETVRAAQITLEEGGNAFDAVMAAMVASSVCEPVLSSMGGGGFLMACPLNQPATVFDFFAQTPGTRAPENLRDFYPVVCDFGTTQQEFHIGRASIAVPGAVKGLFDVINRLGRMPVSKVVEPAIALARDGVNVNEMQARIFQVVGDIYMSTPESRELFASGEDTEKLISAGETFRNEDLADALDAIAREGDALFYRGEISATIDADCQMGGALRRRDLETYEVIHRSPLEVAYKGCKYLTNPPPSCGGMLIAFAMNLLDEMNLHEMRCGGVEHLTALVRAQELTQQARIEARLDDVDVAEAAETLFDPDLMQSYRRQILGVPGSHRGTTHISVIDGDGNAAALTISNGEGSGYIVPDTGIMLNNMLGEEDINPRGFHNWLTNRRMSSMMAPGVLRQADGQLTALGSGGSNRIRTALLQVLIQLIDFQSPLDEAIRAPRLHLEGSRLDIEYGFEPEVAEQISSLHENSKIWDERNLFFGGVHGVGFAPDKKTYRASGDERRNGTGLVLG